MIVSCDHCWNSHHYVNFIELQKIYLNALKESLKISMLGRSWPTSLIAFSPGKLLVLGIARLQAAFYGYLIEYSRVC